VLACRQAAGSKAGVWTAGTGQPVPDSRYPIAGIRRAQAKKPGVRSDRRAGKPDVPVGRDCLAYDVDTLFLAVGAKVTGVT
jgi:hypothetical protein